MPFSFFAARCLYVARQPLKYRQDVIKRIFTANLASKILSLVIALNNHFFPRAPKTDLHCYHLKSHCRWGGKHYWHRLQQQLPTVVTKDT